MVVRITRPIPVEPVEDLGGGNTRDDNGVERYYGYNAAEAVDAAVSEGTLFAWEWLQAWQNGDLDADDAGPYEQY